MDVKGNRVFQISREKLWSYLMDPEVLAKITPGITKLEKLEEDKYKSVSDIKIGPVKGSFTGTLKVEDKVEPSSFSIGMEQLSKIGNAHAKVSMVLNDNGNGTSELEFDGKADLSGMIARTGQRVLSGVANTITKEVFSSLEKHIEEEKTNNTEVVPEESLDNKASLTQEVEKVVEIKEDIESEKDIEKKNVADSKQEVSASGDAGILSGLVNFFKGLLGSN